MPRFASYLSDGMQKLGHSVEVLRPKPYLSQLPLKGSGKKWLGYLDQYVIFSISLFLKSRFSSEKNLYVLSDQALGLWAPIISKKAHVIHCHDFLAFKSAKGEISANPVGFTGKLYQKIIHKGFSKAENFISVSKNTMLELEDLLPQKPQISTYVYNGLNSIFEEGNPTIARKNLSEELNISMADGYFLHVGGNQFYKNRIGLIKIYNHWRDISELKLPLLLIGTAPDQNTRNEYASSKYKDDIIFSSGLSDDMVKQAYQGASVFIFPSLAEGFGWPIAEAMACGCPVVTTNSAPMNEVGGEAAIYIENVDTFDNLESWAQSASKIIEDLVTKKEEELMIIRKTGLENAKRFNSNKTIADINDIYTKAYNLKYGPHENS
ncbi:glycosyltransferase [Zobellia galactanivorans]|uniref:glycosyltransferase n=1 Tax=Zobellia galactanivorans (strain DSM 12802 / CCUG 47099 / CIP 106680 / NCIMB 13871 / Dsij) TaxID=63186 RepID=UPI001C06FA55|nr:glycosyltransferase [Zobellia galactanivorans]MBU3028346.1 glycosyltransferase [Zobellia galactanivorans]